MTTSQSQDADWLADELKHVMEELSKAGRPVYIIVSDNASVISAAIQRLQTSKGTAGVVHHRCGCHCLNPLIQECAKAWGLQETMVKLEKSVPQSVLKSILQHVPTRWCTVVSHLRALIDLCGKGEVPQDVFDILAVLNLLESTVMQMEADTTTLLEENNLISKLQNKLGELHTRFGTLTESSDEEVHLRLSGCLQTPGARIHN